jgi:hypothetical protein
MPGKKGFPLLTAFLLALLLCIRLFLITADPPYDLSTSGGPYGDPGGYSFNARNKVLFGTWEVDEYNMMYLSFPPHLMTFLSFQLLGVGLAQQNLVPVLFSMGSLLLFFLILRRRFSYAWALGGTALLGLNYLFLMYSRVANRVMPPLFFILLGLYFLQKKTRSPVFLFAAGMSFFSALISKSVVFYILAGIGIGYLVYALLHHEIKEIAKQIAFLAMGALVPGMPWLFFIYIPHRDFIHSFSELNVKFLIPPAHLPTLIRNFWTRPPILLEQMPIVCVLAALASLILLSNLVREIKKIVLVDWIFLLWFLVGYLYYALIQQRVPRHVIPQIIPLIFLTISFGHHLLSRTSTAEKKPRFLSALLLFLWFLFPVSMGLKYLAKQFPQVFTGQKILNLALLALSSGLVFLFFVCVKAWSKRKTAILPLSFKRALVFILLALVLILQGSRYLQWALHPQFQFKQASQDLGKALTKATIAGLWAPVICLENKHRAHESFPDFVNDQKDFLEKFKITHVFASTAFNEQEIKYYRQRFPEPMRKAQLLAKYIIWKAEMLLYELRPFKSPPGQKYHFEAELYTRRQGMPRYYPESSGGFSVISNKNQPGFVSAVLTPEKIPEGRYRVIFKMKCAAKSLKTLSRIARIDVVSLDTRRLLGVKNLNKEDFIQIGEYK